MVSLIDGGGNIRHLAAIADHCHIGRTVPQRVRHCSVGFLSQSADHCGTGNENLLAVSIHTEHAIGSDLLAGVLCVYLNFLRCNFFQQQRAVPDIGIGSQLAAHLNERYLLALPCQMDGCLATS